MSILDLPIEQQKEIAASLGQSFDAWKKSVRQALASAKKYPKPQMGIPSERAKFIQSRMDAETPSDDVENRGKRFKRIV